MHLDPGLQLEHGTRTLHHARRLRGGQVLKKIFQNISKNISNRFYLGHWQEGIGKLFSFGGLGVWTLVDVALVATRYIGPADGSLYV